MATNVKHRQWDGGDGMHDRITALFQCKETPEEVLRVLFKNCLIYSYKGIMTPVDSAFPNNAEGLIIEDASIEDPYLSSIISEKGLSIHNLDIRQIKGYDNRIGRSPMVFEKTIVRHLKSELDPKYYYGYKGLEKLKALSGQNYLYVRNTDLISELKTSKEKVLYWFPNGKVVDVPFIGRDWVDQQEKKLLLIFEIAKVILEFESIDELIPLYEKYKMKKAEVY